MKTCHICKNTKPPSEFKIRNQKPIGRCLDCLKQYNQTRYKEKYKQQCKQRYIVEKDSILEKSRAWSKANPNPRRLTPDQRIQRKYGVEAGFKEKLIEKQHNKCAICASVLELDKPNHVTLDHCHSSGRIRGVLCRSCNWMLGFARDNINTLVSAIEYLERTNH